MTPEIMQNMVQMLNQMPTQAPRPLALHLAIQTMTYTGSLSALPNLNSVLQSWKNNASQNTGQLMNEISATDPSAFAEAVQQEVQDRVRLFAEGVNKLTSAEREECQPPLECVFEEGTTKLLRAQADGPPVIFIPSLINRAHILDLCEGNSLVRACRDHGLDVFLVDWDVPGDVEKSYKIDNYIDRLERIRDVVAERVGQTPMIAGYCMGGLLALALAARAPEKISKMALLATPWDFSHMPRPGIQHLRNSMPWLRSIIDINEMLPVDVLQAMFAGIDPCATARKFRQFAEMDEKSPAARAFVQLEDWLNDGIPLAGPVARECLQDWYIDNVTAMGKWQTGRIVVDPKSLSVPSMVIVPQNDIIVPPATALPLGELLPSAETTVLSSGHIGMIVGGRARRQLFDPLSSWLLNPA